MMDQPGRPGVLGAVLGGEGREDEDVEEEDEPEEEAEEVTLSSAAATLTEDLFNSPTFRTSVSSRPAYLTQYQVTSATYVLVPAKHELMISLDDFFNFLRSAG